MHMVPIDRSNMNHHLVTSRDLTDQLAHEDQRPLPTLDIDISLPTRYDTYSPRSYGCQISPSASHRMLRIPSPKGEGFTDPQNATLNLLKNAIDAMHSVHPRLLSVKSELAGFDRVH